MHPDGMLGTVDGLLQLFEKMFASFRPAFGLLVKQRDYRDATSVEEDADGVEQ